MIMYCIEDTLSVCGEFKFETGKRYSLSFIGYNGRGGYMVTGGSMYIPNGRIIVRDITKFFQMGSYIRGLQNRMRGLLV